MHDSRPINGRFLTNRVAAGRQEGLTNGGAGLASDSALPSNTGMLPNNSPALWMRDMQSYQATLTVHSAAITVFSEVHVRPTYQLDTVLRRVCPTTFFHKRNFGNVFNHLNILVLIENNHVLGNLGNVSARAKSLVSAMLIVSKLYLKHALDSTSANRVFEL